MGRLFGSDGVRGRANQDLTAELALDLAVAASHVLGESGAQRRLKALVGRDPRISGQFLECAVVAGLASTGVDVVRVGVIPTPGLAHLVRAGGADLGVMLTASHNPMPENGIKFFRAGGWKLDDAAEDAIEAQLLEPWQRPMGAAVGRVSDAPQLVEEYVHHLVSTLRTVTQDNISLVGLKVVLDLANGAGHRTAPAAFRELGAEVVVINGKPDGTNINDRCGSTHPEELQRAVLEHGADLGIALDGDADRAIAVAADGEIVDGDQMIAILALAMQERGLLKGRAVVVTSMSNLGLDHALKDRGIDVIRTDVGDRHVMRAMRDGGYNLGGEPVGHVILRDLATTGDGALTALMLMAVMSDSGAPLAELASVVQRIPQVLINVPDVDKHRVETDADVVAAVAAANAALGARGRVLLRPSGTEQVVRVMVECEDAERSRAVAEGLAAVVAERLTLRTTTPRSTARG
ncbi:phosphoglucosamine mutase [Raineyella fluvialis]|uniref:Phosphoglucosamine mutase n=1 Tax=Raineyella fluvialis TaxID=2662261 RepID=A0A5Q2FC96_9ACTN|nr:phosphoglucosamine mutase [Raineyella fluvialis]QGF22703.1 phosphoglucosamine mutase [Raineyella fluvialis]